MNDLKSPMLEDVKPVKKKKVKESWPAAPNPIIDWLKSGKRAKWDWRHWFMATSISVFLAFFWFIIYLIFTDGNIRLSTMGIYVGITLFISTFLYCMFSVDND